MGTKVRNTVVAAVIAVLASSAFALGNSVSVACIDEGASSAVKRSQQEALLISAATPASIEAYEAASDAARQATEQQLRRELEALGIWVD